MNLIQTEAATSLLSVVSLAILWKLIKLWNNHRVDTIRQDLFEVRDELFDVALKHPFLFKHPSYVRLRQSVNICIRFAHKFTSTRLVVTIFVRQLWALPKDNWPDTLVGLPGEIKVELLRVQRGMQFRLGCHLLHLPMRAAWLILDFLKRVSVVVATKAKQEISDKVEILEVQAAEEYEMESRGGYGSFAAAPGR
jgi:hypothetical protein